MTPDQAEETVRRDAADFMQHNTTSDLSARRMCRVGFRELTLMLAHYDGLKRAVNAMTVRPDFWAEYEDEITNAIADSMDMDWTSRDGARAVVRFLNTIAAGHLAQEGEANG